MFPGVEGFWVGRIRVAVRVDADKESKTLWESLWPYRVALYHKETTQNKGQSRLTCAFVDSIDFTYDITAQNLSLALP